jgi:Tfp pilus assembly protein FimT
MKATSGVTLLELTVAMAVLMAVVGVIFVGTRGDNSDYRALQNAALTLQADLRYAQRRAVTEGRRVGIQLDPANNRYRIITTQPLLQTLRYVYLDVEILSTNHLDNRILYLPRGTANPGTLLLRNGRHTQRITTTLSGGQVRIHDIISE